MFRLLVLLLIVSSSAQFAGAFKPNLPPAKDTQVLVVGANGRIGEQVCALLEGHAMCVHWYREVVLQVVFHVSSSLLFLWGGCGGWVVLFLVGLSSPRRWDML